jgi:hypothetical protein
MEKKTAYELDLKEARGSPASHIVWDQTSFRNFGPS